MRPDGHCGFRAIAHAIFKCQDDWNDIRTSLLNHLESYGKDDANPYVLAAGTKFGVLKDSLECRAAEGATRSQWFHDTWHGQLVMDRYNIFLVSAGKVGGTKVLIRTPTGYTSVNAVLDAIQSGNPLIGLLFDRNCENFDALEFSTEARALLAGRAYSTIMLSLVGRL